MRVVVVLALIACACMIGAWVVLVFMQKLSNSPIFGVTLIATALVLVLGGIASRKYPAFGISLMLAGLSSAFAQFLIYMLAKGGL